MRQRNPIRRRSDVKTQSIQFAAVESKKRWGCVIFIYCLKMECYVPFFIFFRRKITFLNTMLGSGFQQRHFNDIQDKTREMQQCNLSRLMWVYLCCCLLHRYKVSSTSGSKQNYRAKNASCFSLSPPLLMFYNLLMAAH